MRINTIREKVAQCLDADESDDIIVRAVDVFLIILIGLNVMAIIFESEAGFEEQYKTLLYRFEVFSIVVFTAEYILRVWSCVDSRKQYALNPVRGRLRYMLTPMALVDLIAIVPFYLVFFIPIDLRFLRVLRLLRVFKLTRYSRAMHVLLSVLQEEASSLAAAFSVLFVLLILAASGIYLIEHDVQPDSFGSIMSSMWWAMATLTTVGYGDVTPITTAGRFFGGCITLIGMGMVALPAGILASAFSDQLHRRREAYTEKLDNALKDGIVTQEERSTLVSLQEELGLSESDAEELQRLLASYSHEINCPHCGEKLLS
jgi:voltage-gated potassium channel